MVFRIIWVDRVALRGAEAAVGCKELAIVTTKKTHIKNANRRSQAKLSLLKGSHLI